MTVLDIAIAAAQRLQLPVPATFIGSTDNNMLLLKAMIDRATTEISDDFTWPELQAQYRFRLDKDVEAYPLPADLDAIMFETLWNRTQHYPLIGPVDAVGWQNYKSGIMATLPRQRFRVMGWNANQFFIDPRPTETDAEQYAVFEYYTSNRYKPRTWTASTAVALNAYYSINGEIYKCTTSGTTNTFSPNASNVGNTAQTVIGYDNTVQWTQVPLWIANTVYRVGDYVQWNGGSAPYHVYKCTADGTSNLVTEPTHTSGTAINGTAYFEYITSASSRAIGTEYTPESLTLGYVYESSRNNVYRCTIAGRSGTDSTAPSVLNFSRSPSTGITSVTDNTAVWAWQSTYPGMVADTDNTLLDQDIILDGAVWRFKMERGFAYENLRRIAEEQLDIAKTKLIGAGVLSVNGRRLDTPMIGPWSYPISNYGI